MPATNKHSRPAPLAARTNAGGGGGGSASSSPEGKRQRSDAQTQQQQKQQKQPQQQAKQPQKPQAQRAQKPHQQEKQPQQPSEKAAAAASAMGEDSTDSDEGPRYPFRSKQPPPPLPPPKQQKQPPPSPKKEGAGKGGKQGAAAAAAGAAAAAAGGGGRLKRPALEVEMLKNQKTMTPKEFAHWKLSALAPPTFALQKTDACFFAEYLIAKAEAAWAQGEEDDTTVDPCSVNVVEWLKEQWYQKWSKEPETVARLLALKMALWGEGSS